MMSDNPLIFDPDRSRRLLSLNPDPNLIILKRNNMQPTALGRYQVASILGRGSMGVVYRGHDPVIDRPVALKSVLLPESISDEEKKIFLERFFLEARAAGKLTHPNVVITHDAATDEATGIPFIAMELVDGDTLADRLRQEGTLAWEKAVDFVVPIAGGLAKAHAAGIVHRDIKPANILIADGEVPKIADFGIAKLPASKLTQEGNIVGTPYFMSPEQLRGEPLDGRSDLFSLGALLYNLVAGRPPSEGSDPAAIFAQTLYKEPAPLSEIAPAAPSSLDRVVAHALAKNANERYRSALELIEDLRAVRAGEAPKHAAAHDQQKAQKTLVSRADIADIANVEATIASGKATVPRAPLSLAPSKIIAIGLGLVLILAFWFRTEIGREMRFWQADRAASAGELVESEAILETFLEEHPEFERARALMAAISAELLVPELPMELGARHNHRFGHCNGTLTLGDSGVQYVSRNHGTWGWDFEHIQSLDSSNEWRITLSTREDDMLGLLDTKRYVFELRSRPVERETWKRYERIFEANRASKTRE